MPRDCRNANTRSNRAAAFAGAGGPTQYGVASAGGAGHRISPLVALLFPLRYELKL